MRTPSQTRLKSEGIRDHGRAPNQQEREQDDAWSACNFLNSGLHKLSMALPPAIT